MAGTKVFRPELSFANGLACGLNNDSIEYPTTSVDPALAGAILQLIWGAAQLFALVAGMIVLACFIDYLVDAYQETPWALPWPFS